MPNQDEPHRRPREVIREDLAGAAPAIERNKWALIVGISDYRDPQIASLKYAHADARALYDHLTDPRCGGYPPDQIRMLLNEHATGAAIRDGLYTFLQQPGPEDFVIVFFACHGGPNPNRPSSLYVFPHDTERARIAATAISMDHVKEALSARNLLAERVILLADTCHAGGLNREGARSVDAADAMNRFVQDMARSRPGMATLTAAEQGEVAWEGPEWGDGHGVFTHFLLEGLRGGAARPEDGIVTVGELFDYVQDKVFSATAPERPQHPCATLTADTRKWTVAVMSDLFCDEYYRLGRALSVVGQRLGDRGRLEVAIDQQETAIGLARKVGRALPSARYEIGRCELAAGEYRGALTALHAAAEEVDAEARAGRPVPDGLIANIRFWTWAAALQSRSHAATELAAARFREDHGADPRVVLVDTMSRLCSLRRHGLLIGVDLDSQGPSNDVSAMRQLLLDAGYAESDLLVHNTRATTTRAAIFEALERLRRITAEDDEVVIYLAGRSVRRPAPDSAARSMIQFLPSDHEDSPDSVIRPPELHAALESVPAKQVLVVIDTCYGGGLIEHVRASTRYALLSGSSEYERSEEHEIAGVMRGVFSAALVPALCESPREAAHPVGDALRDVEQAMPEDRAPVYVGSNTLPTFSNLKQAASIVSALRRSQHEYLGGCSRRDLERMAAGLTLGIRSALPVLCESIGRACLDLRMHGTAAMLFDRAVSSGVNPVVGHLGHAVSQSHLGHYATAEQAVDAAAPLLGPDSLAACRAALTKLQHCQIRRALLVGVSRSSSVHVALGVINDVRAMHRALEELPGMIEVEELLDAQATRDAILDRFRDLVERAAEAPCLFFFAGPGTTYGEPAVEAFSSSSYNKSTIGLRELAKIAGPRVKNLVCIIDAGWIEPTPLPWRALNMNRCEADWPRNKVRLAGDWILPAAAPHPVPRPREPASYRDVEPQYDDEFVSRRARRTAALDHLAIGGITIYNSALLMRMCPEGAEPGEQIVEAELPALWEPRTPVTHGILTHALLGALLASVSRPSSYKQLQYHSVPHLQWLQPVFIGTGSEERFMSNIVLEDEFERVLRKESLDRPLFEAIALLRTRLKRLEGMEDGSRKRDLLRVTYRELGIACLSTGDIAQAKEELERALDSDGSRDPDIRGYLGRALVEQGDDLDAAVWHLQEAIELYASAPPAYASYFYGRGLRERMENRRREDSERLQRAWQRYLQQGAPLGHRSEVEDFFVKVPR